MGLLIKALVFVAIVNALFILVQAATWDMNPGGTVQVYDCQGDIFSQYDQNNCLTQEHVFTGTNASQLPGSTNTIEPDTGNIFTDTFNSIKRWFSQAIGLDYLSHLLSGPNRFLTAMNLPSTVTWVLSAFWYVITLIIIISFIKGGEA